MISTKGFIFSLYKIFKIIMQLFLYVYAALTEKEMYLLLIDSLLHAKTILDTLYKLHFIVLMFVK